MPRRLSTSLVLCLLILSLAPPASAGERRVIDGTYQLIAKDVVDGHGHLRDVYDDLLVTESRSYRLRLPRGMQRPRGGTPVRVTGTLSGQDMQAEEVQATAAPSAVTTTGTTKVLVMLVYWTAPDSVTQSQAKAQVFTDDNGYFAEASYGQLGLTGTATPWMKITGPTGGLCYSNHMQIMDRAKTAATGKGYNLSSYDRFIAYFPGCTGGDSAGAAGWAYQPGTEVWLNGYFDRRVSVHEQGHNYGLYHAHTLDCMQSGKRVTLSAVSNCSQVEYGDNFDAMGASNYAGHFSAVMKDRLGWLAGRKRSLSSSAATFTLPPFEVSSSTPVAAVATTSVSTRKYWIEFRRARGYDSALPSGATNGVLVHMRDTAVTPGPMLLDATPQNGWDDTAIPPGGAWTSPEGVRISVGSVSSTGASVTVDGAADPPTVPSAPRSVAATGGDESARVSWTAPLSNGGATISGYEVTTSGTGPGIPRVDVDGSSRTATIEGLNNGTAYTFSVRARNAVGLSAAGTTGATPSPQLPSVTLTSPAVGATIGGTVTLSATASPNPSSLQPIGYVEFGVDGQAVEWDYEAPYSVEWDSSYTPDGAHTITATAYDSGSRFATSSVSVSTLQPRPTVTITAPADGATITEDIVTLTATAAPPAGIDSEVQYVEYAVDGEPVAYGWAPDFSATWDTTTSNGPHTLVAKVYDSNYTTGLSAPVTVTVDHPVPIVSITAPAAGANVSGGAVTVTADAAPEPDGPSVYSVEFFVDGSTSIGWISEAPYTASWNTAGLSGTHELTAVATDVAGHRGVSSPVSVDVDNPVPAVVVTAPAERANLDPGTITLSADADPNTVSDSPIARVEFSVDGWLVSDVPAPGPYTTTWDGTSGYGLHNVVATAYDEAGQFTRSAPVTFNVETPSPTVAISAPTDEALLPRGMRTVTLNLAPDAGTNTPLLFAELYVDGAYAGYQNAAGASTVTFDWLATRGEHVLSAIAYDEQYFSGSAAPVAVTVADIASAPTGVAAVAGVGEATVSWTDPEDDGGSAITAYEVVRNDGVEYAATGSPFVVTGLTNRTAYTFKVRAVTALGDGALSAPSASVTPGTTTTLSIAVSKTLVTYPGSVTVTGTLRRADTNAGLAGRTVKLLHCAPGTTTCSAAKTVTTSSTGAVSIPYVLDKHRELRLKFYGADQFIAKTSGAKLVRVRVGVTSAISRTSMPLGRSATVSGVVKPKHVGKYVYLQRYYSGSWHNVTKRLTNSYSKVWYSVTPRSRGTYKYRWKFLEDADHLAGVSATRSVKVY